MFRKCEGNAGEAVEQEGKICDEVEAVREIYLDHRCEAAAKTRCRWWVMFRKCKESYVEWKLRELITCW